ncbi:unnamed protein product, partial [Phaeothamnion confervicola]
MPPRKATTATPAVHGSVIGSPPIRARGRPVALPNRRWPAADTVKRNEIMGQVKATSATPAAPINAQKEKAFAATAAGAPRAREGEAPLPWGQLSTATAPASSPAAPEALVAAALAAPAAHAGSSPAFSGISGSPSAGTAVVFGVADRVISEYERLLAAVPTLAQHINRTQVDTDAMATALAGRVTHLVEGYRQLNELAAQAPVGILSAASDYARQLREHPLLAEAGRHGLGGSGGGGSSGSGGGGRRGGGGGSGGGAESGSSNVAETLHQQLFEMREARLALDREAGGNGGGGSGSSSGVSKPETARASTGKRRAAARAESDYDGAGRRGAAGVGSIPAATHATLPPANPKAPLFVPRFPGYTNCQAFGGAPAGPGGGGFFDGFEGAGSRSAGTAATA